MIIVDYLYHDSVSLVSREQFHDSNRIALGQSGTV
jgi:hypothetical protein